MAFLHAILGADKDLRIERGFEKPQTSGTGILMGRSLLGFHEGRLIQDYLASRIKLDAANLSTESADSIHGHGLSGSSRCFADRGLAIRASRGALARVVDICCCPGARRIVSRLYGMAI